MSVKLKQHNEEAYEKIKEMIERGNKAAVIHPTGTGKSYIAIKLIEDNKDAHTLFISSFNPILHQLKENIREAEDGKMFGNLDRMTYQKLSMLSEQEIEDLKPEIIVLDEFHHCGAPIWGEAVQKLIEKNPNAKVLGLSATPIRYFDGNVDMAEELFQDAIASEISFEEAVEKGILPGFDYVSAMHNYEESLEEIKSRIEEQADKLAPSKIEEARALYSQLKNQLGSNVVNIQEIFETYMKNKSGKYMVFCRNIEDMNKKIEEAQEMFSKVNPNMKIYRVSSSVDDIKQNEKLLTEFKTDQTPDTLKLMFSVNMLSEGYHLPDVDGVVMMRPTQSPTVYQQQIGRALTVGNKEGKRPVIIDLVDNFDSISIIEDFSERMKQYKGNPPNEEKKENEDNSKVRLYDYVKESNEIINKIQKLSRRVSLSFDEKIELFEKFYEDPNTDGEIIYDTVYEGYPIGIYLTQIRHEIKIGKGNYTEEQKNLLNELRILRQKKNDYR